MEMLSLILVKMENFMKDELFKTTFKGVAFGLLFPTIAILGDLWLKNLSLSMANLRIIHALNPLHYIIETVPIFLGYYAAQVGIRQRYINGEYRRLELEVVKRTENLKQLTEKLGEFAHTVSHDLKAPLTTIIGLQRLIQNDSDNDLSEDSENYLELISLKAFDMDRLIHETLEDSLSDGLKRHPEIVNLDSMVKGILEYLSVDNKFDVHIQEKLPIVYGREVELTQVFQNIISNALTYNDKKRAAIEINSKETPMSWEFCISDNGPGIPDKDQERIFDLRVSLNKTKSTESTGVGLHIVRKIIKENGGRVWVESELGTGTCFCFTWSKELGTGRANGNSAAQDTSTFFLNSTLQSAQK